MKLNCELYRAVSIPFYIEKFSVNAIGNVSLGTLAKTSSAAMIIVINGANCSDTKKNILVVITSGEYLSIAYCVIGFSAVSVSIIFFRLNCRVTIMMMIEVIDDMAVQHT